MRNITFKQGYFHLRHLLHSLFYVFVDQSITCFVYHLLTIRLALWKIVVTIFKVQELEFQQKFGSPKKKFEEKIYTTKTVTTTAQSWHKRTSWNVEDSNKKSHHPRTSAWLAIKPLALGGKVLPEEDASKERLHIRVLRVLCKALQTSDFMREGR